MFGADFDNRQNAKKVDLEPRVHGGFGRTDLVHSEWEGGQSTGQSHGQRAGGGLAGRVIDWSEWVIRVAFFSEGGPETVRLAAGLWISAAPARFAALGRLLRGQLVAGEERDVLGAARSAVVEAGRHDAAAAGARWRR